MHGRHPCRFLLLFLGLLFLSVAVDAAPRREAPAFPESFLEEAERYPDLTQTDAGAGLPWGGWFHCGPVAVSNGLIWLRERGIPMGPEASGDRRADQVEMARRLGSSLYMNTGFSSRGTTVAAFLSGLEGYLRDHSSGAFSIHYMGWGAHEPRFSTGLRAPDFAGICRAFAGGSAVFLDLGWYLDRKDTGVYRRNGGHWVTLVGYDWPRERRFPVLYLHDPAPWSGTSPRTHRVTLAPAGRSMFTTRYGEAIGSLAPYARITGGLIFKRGTEMAVIEGAVILTSDVKPLVPWSREEKEATPPLWRPSGRGER